MIALGLALSILTLPAVAAGPHAGTAGAPSVEDSGGVWWVAWARAWADLWSRWGPPGGGDVPADAVRTSVDDGGDTGIGSVAALSCSEPDDPTCEGSPDWDPDG